MSMSPVTKAGWITLISTMALISGAAVQSAIAAEALGQGTPFADGTVEAGTLKAPTCSACHGPNGNSTTRSVAQDRRSERGLHRPNSCSCSRPVCASIPICRKSPAPSSAKDIDSVAVYFQAQTPVGGEADASMERGGENLYRFGDPARDIPACTACHGPVGRGNAVADFPALRAQFADYVVKQLNDFASGARYSGAKPGAPTSRNGYMMSTIAKRLNGDDIKELAAYIQGMR